MKDETGLTACLKPLMGGWRFTSGRVLSSGLGRAETPIRRLQEDVHSPVSYFACNVEWVWH
jgi:hypothetical protein